jgi:hypothetical protein
LFLFLSFAAYASLTVLSGGCANSSVSPTGGAKDTIPPVLMNMIPAQRTQNFKGKELTFTFNEYVQLKDQNKKFIISPPLPEKKPELRIKGKSVVVRFPVSPADSTTYYIDFGTSVVDLNEGNPAESLNFIFSTGNEIDTMIYAGVIIDAFTLEPVDGASAFLYEHNIDSIPYKQNPSALSKTDKDGAFMIKGLKNIAYKIVAVLDGNSNYRYDPASERIAFNDSLIQPYWLSDKDSIALAALPLLNMFSEPASRQALLDYKRPESRLLQLVFNSPHSQIDNFSLRDISANDLIRETSIAGDTVKYWITTRTMPDSLIASITYMKTDSLNLLSPDTRELKFPVEKKKEKKGKKDDEDENEDEEFVPIVPNISLNPARIYERGVPVSFKTPLLRVDTAKMQLRIFDDEGKEKTLIRFTFEKDSARLLNYLLNAAWKTASKYELTILPEAFVDIYGIPNDSIVKSFNTADPDKYGVLKVELANADQPYIIQVLKDKNIVAEKAVSGNGEYTFAYLEAGKYRIRLIEDDNGNKRWDTGNYLLHRQAERVRILKFGDGEETISMRASWEIKQPVDIKEVFR